MTLFECLSVTINDGELLGWCGFVSQQRSYARLELVSALLYSQFRNSQVASSSNLLECDISSVAKWTATHATAVHRVRARGVASRPTTSRCQVSIPAADVDFERTQPLLVQRIVLSIVNEDRANA